MSFLAGFYQQPPSIQEVIRRLAEESAPQKIKLFGSRARGDHRPHSDFDIAVEGRACTDSQWTQLILSLESEPITLRLFDVVEVEKLGVEYLEQLDKEGVLLYESD